MKLEQLTGERNCECGRTHFVPTERIDTSSEWAKRFSTFLRQKGYRCGLLVADSTTWNVLGESVFARCRLLGLTLDVLIYDRDSPLVADEKALGELMLAFSPEHQFFLAVGSGTISDLVRYASYCYGLPFIVLATAPSMDGYASSVAPLMRRQVKETFSAHPPQAIFSAPEVVAAAPTEMISAGIGDMAGKITARADWQLGRIRCGEYFCGYAEQLMSAATQNCLSQAQDAVSRRLEAGQELMEGLILSGLVISLVGNSRPASGAEHLLSHYWEMRGLEEGVSLPLHGQKVGVATVLVLRLYELVGPIDGVKLDVSSTELQKILDSIGAASNFRQLGLPAQWVHDGLQQAHQLRPRYTIFDFLKDRGLLEQFSRDVVD